MEIFIRVNKSNVVEFIHLNPFDPTDGLGLSREELLSQGKFVNELPDLQPKKGHKSIAMYDPDKNSVYFKYEPVPLKDSSRLDMLEKAFNAMILNNRSRKESE